MHLMKSYLAHAAATLKNRSNRNFSAPFSAALSLAARTASCPPFISCRNDCLMH